MFVRDASCCQASDFATLAKASSVKAIMREEPPEGCAVHIIDDQCQVGVVMGLERLSSRAAAIG